MPQRLQDGDLAERLAQVLLVQTCLVYDFDGNLQQILRANRETDLLVLDGEIFKCVSGFRKGIFQLGSFIKKFVRKYSRANLETVALLIAYLRFSP